MRAISLDLIRVTEAAAIAASKWVGSGNKLEADRAATDAMRDRLNRMDFAAKIAIGEGEKDESYGLFAGEKVGRKKNNYYEIAVDPIEGTSPTVYCGPEAMSVMAVAKEGSMFSTPYHYMRKIAYGPEIKNKVKLNVNEPLEEIVEKVKNALGKDQIMVCMLNRPRHDDYVKKLRSIGARIKLIQDCDVSGAVATCVENEVDLLYGIGGAPEAVISACAIKCMGGDMQAQCVEPEDSKKVRWKSVDEVREMEDLVQGECLFVATGVTSGSLLRGVQWTNKGPITHSVFMRSVSNTVRWLEVHHGN